MFVLMIIIVIISNVFSIFLFHIDAKNNGQNQTEKAGKWYLAKSAWIYAGIMSVLTIEITILFQIIYVDNSFLFSLKRLLLLGLLWPIAYIDFKTYRIPNLFIASGLLIRVALLILEVIFERSGLLSTIVSEGIASLALVIAAFLCTLLIKNSIGFGDIKLFIIMGLYLGLGGIWSAVFMALLVSFLISVVLLLTKKKTRKDTIPFGPSIVIGTYLSVFLTGM